MSTTTLRSLSLTAGSLSNLQSRLKSNQLVKRLILLFPGSYKLLFCFLLLINLRSLPFAWHIRIFRPVFVIRLQYYLFRLRLFFKPRSIHMAEKARWLESIAPIGADPLEHVTVYNTWASIDDCDFNGHLSNSSYGTTLDAARLKTAVASFPYFFRAGGRMALRATHYTFIREIPMSAPYEVQLCTVGWDNKWLFLVARFVTFSNPNDKKSKPARAAGDTDLGTPSPASNGLSTPTDLSSVGQNMNEDGLAAALCLAPTLQQERTVTVHCTSVSQLCFKHGRITVPPAVALATNGYSAPPPSSSSPPYSHDSPPPHWTHVRALLASPKEYTNFLRGEWRNVGEGERWWEDALGGVVEERRCASMEVLEGAREGLSGVGDVFAGDGGRQAERDRHRFGIGSFL